MIDCVGRWLEEVDYSQFPKEKWCDMDYMADWIRRIGYNPVISLHRLIDRILDSYNEWREEHDFSLYAREESRPIPYCYMVNMEDIVVYVEDNGGLKSFDYES